APGGVAGLPSGPPGGGGLRGSGEALHACLRALRPGTVRTHDHPGCGPASERELGHDQGDSEAAFAAAFQQTDAAEVAADCHRRDRRRQGTPLPQRGAGLGERGGSLRGRRQRGRRLGTFWKRLRPSRAKIKAVATDMSVAYIVAVREHLPRAVHVFDHFHVIKLFNDKLSDFRRELYREATERMHKDVLKGTRWLLLKNPENLDPTRNERERLEEA